MYKYLTFLIVLCLPFTLCAVPRNVEIHTCRWWGPEFERTGYTPSAKFELPRVQNTEVQEKLNKTIEQLCEEVNVFFELPQEEDDTRYKEHFEELHLEIRNLYIDPNEFEWVQETNVGTRILTDHPHLVCLNIEASHIQDFWPRPYYSQANVSFDPTSGKLIDVMSLFKPVAQERIYAKVQAEIYKECDETCDKCLQRVPTKEELKTELKDGFVIEGRKVLFILDNDRITKFVRGETVVEEPFTRENLVKEYQHLFIN